jgi:hypothetical protein
MQIDIILHAPDVNGYMHAYSYEPPWHIRISQPIPAILLSFGNVSTSDTLSPPRLDGDLVETSGIMGICHEPPHALGITQIMSFINDKTTNHVHFPEILSSVVEDFCRQVMSSA